MKYLRLWLAASLLLLMPAFAHAQLTLTFDTPNQSGQPGDTLTFAGTLTNTSASLLFFSGDSFTLGGTDLVLDDSPFFLEGPLSLEAGEVFTGPLFTVQIGPSTPSQFAPGTFTILGGLNEGDQNELATSSFSVSVTAPEPSSGLLVLGTTLTAAFALRRRKRIGNVRGVPALF